MVLLLPMGILVIVSICLSMMIRIKIEKALPISCFGMIMVSYLFSALGIMGNWLLYILLFLTIILCFISVMIWRKRGQRWHHLKPLIITPGFAVFLFFAVAMFFFTRKMQAHEWDDFTHWTKTVKYMYYTDSLSVTCSSLIDFAAYPPSLAIWEYLFVNYAKPYTDAYVIYAYNMYCILMLLPLFSETGDKKGRWFFTPICALLIFLIPYLSYSPYEASTWRATYCDRALALTFGYLLFTYFGPSENKAEKTTGLALGFAVLSLIKNSGNGLNAIVLGIILIDLIGRKRKNDSRLPIKSLLVIGGIWLIAFVSWKGVTAYYNVHDVWGGYSITFEKVWKLICGQEEAFRYNLIPAMWNELFKDIGFEGTQGILKIQHILYPVIWAIPILILKLSDRKEPEDGKTVRSPSWIVIVAAFAVYIIGLYFIYSYYLYPLITSDGETFALTSFNRYIMDFTLGITVFLFGLLWTRIQQFQAKPKIVGAVCLTAFVLCITPISDPIIPDVFDHANETQRGYERTGFVGHEEVERKYGAKMTGDDRVCVIGWDGIDRWIMYKALLPAKVDYYTAEGVHDLLDKIKTEDSWGTKKWTGIYLSGPIYSSFFRDLFLLKKAAEQDIKLLNNREIEEAVQSYPKAYNKDLGLTSSPVMSGIHGDAFVEKTFQIGLLDSKIAKKGLIIRFYYPPQMSSVTNGEPVTVSLQINGQDIGTYEIPGDGIVIIPPDLIERNEYDAYIIKGEMSHVFVPNEVDKENPDMRVLSLLLMQIEANP